MGGVLDFTDFLRKIVKSFIEVVFLNILCFLNFKYALISVIGIMNLVSRIFKWNSPLILVVLDRFDSLTELLLVWKQVSEVFYFRIQIFTWYNVETVDSGAASFIHVFDV